MKAITTPLIITSIRSRKDSSLGVSFETPELTSAEKVAFMELQGINLKGLFEATDTETTETLSVEKEPGYKSPSQTLRAVIYLVCKKLGKPEDADTVYYREMQTIIDKYKSKLETLSE